MKCEKTPEKVTETGENGTISGQIE